MSSTRPATATRARISVPQKALAEFCRRWDVSELALFGSVLRDDFRADSDVDVLISFAPHARHTLKDWFGMIDELKRLFKRDVDLVDRSVIERDINWYRKREILRSAEVIYVA